MVPAIREIAAAIGANPAGIGAILGTIEGIVVAFPTGAIVSAPSGRRRA
jgi:hypothetical protein